MKTAEEIRNEIEGNREYLLRKGDSINQREYKRIIRQNEELREILMYLETEPREEFVISERDRVEKVLESKNSQYPYWAKNCCPDNVEIKKRRSLYNKEQGITILQKQLKTLNLILNKY